MNIKINASVVLFFMLCLSQRKKWADFWLNNFLRITNKQS